jgi:hypothetical protein
MKYFFRPEEYSREVRFPFAHISVSLHVIKIFEIKFGSINRETAYSNHQHVLLLDNLTPWHALNLALCTDMHFISLVKHTVPIAGCLTGFHPMPHIYREQFKKKLAYL